MENVTFSEVWVWLAAVFSGFILLSNVAEKVVKIWKAAKAPDDQQNGRIGKLEERMDHVEACLDNDNKRLENMGEDNRIIQRSLLALLDHGIDGNNIEQMRHAKEELQNHLINR